MRHLPPFPLLLAVVVAVAAACGDATGPGFGPVPEEPGESTVFDFRTSSVRDPSAFDAIAGGPARTDQSSQWDYIFAVREDGTAELRPRAAVLDERSDAGLQTLDRSFSDVVRVPEEGYVTEAPVEVEEGMVLAGRSRQDPGFGIRCPHFLKLEVLELDRSDGTITLRHLVNPACGRRNVAPGSSNRD